MNVFGVRIDPLTRESAAQAILEQIKQSTRPTIYVVTPNVDHVLLLEHNTCFRDAYSDAGLTLIDGKPVFLAARLLGYQVPETVPGSDLVPEVFNTAAKFIQPIKVFLLGGSPDVARMAAGNIQRNWPSVKIVGVCSPPRGFENDADANERIIFLINSAKPDLLVIGLGAPKQELWIHNHRMELDCSVALCVGAAIDFLAGAKKRAPRWMRAVGLEWVHRLLTEPRRLYKRYLKGAVIFPAIFFREWVGARLGRRLKSPRHRGS